MANINLIVELPERQNAFFNTMSTLLPKQIYNVDPEFMIPRIAPVPIEGTVVPFATVKVFVNGLDQSPVPDIVADSIGSWSADVLLTPGQNTIQVQFFPPEIVELIQDAHSPAQTTQNVLVHPTLFSAFSLGSVVTDMRLDGTELFIGGASGTGPDTIVKYDITTGIGTFLAFGTSAPAAGSVRVLALDSSWLYSSQTMGDASIKVSRYAKDFSTRADLTYATVPNYLYADGTNLFVVRDNGGDVRLSKVTPASMTLVGSEISIKNGSVGESVIKHEAVGDDGTNLVIPTSRIIVGDSPGNDIRPGSPDLGANLIFWNILFHRKIKKSDMSDQGNLSTYSTFNSPTENFVPKNSLVRFGGYYYSLVLSNPGKVIKLQEGTVDGLPALAPIDVTPLPFDTTDSANTLTARMKLGPDSRLYVVGQSGMARLVPGSSSVQYLLRGDLTIEATASDVAVVDDGVNTRVLDAPIGIFTDRALTFVATTPVAAPASVACHYNNTQTGVGVGWTTTGDGSAYIVEQAINAGAFSEVRREYFGNGMFVQSSALPAFTSGDTLRFRVKAFNTAGVSAPSAEATFAVPYLTPPLGDCTVMALTSVVGNNVTLNFDDGEIVLGGPIDATHNRPHVLFLYRSPDGLTGWTQVDARSMIPSSTQPDGTPVGGAFYYNPITRANTNVTMVDSTAGAYPYFYRVRAEQRSGPSLTFSGLVYGPGNYSNVVEADAPPATPTSVSWQPGWEGVHVSWTPGVGGGVVSSYTVKRSIDNTATFPVLVTGVTLTSYTDATAFAQTQVRYDKISAQGPGGSSADSPVQGGPSLTPVYHEIQIANTGSGTTGLHLDGSFAYVISGDGAGVNTAITKISLSDSSVRVQNLSVHVPIGTFDFIPSSIMFGGFIYILIKDQGESNARILKVDPSNLTVVNSLLLTTGSIFPSNAGAVLVTDGTSCWAITGSTNNARVTHFDPVTMSNISTGSSLGSNLIVQSARAFGGNIYVGIFNSSTSAGQISRINTSTLSIDQTVAVNAISSPDNIVDDGSNIYAHGAVGSNGIIEKFSTGPLTYVASSASLGLNTVTCMVYDSGSAALYLVHRHSSTSGLMKVSTAPAFVSAIPNIHFPAGTKDGSRTDGTYVYFNNNNGYVSREAIASF